MKQVAYLVVLCPVLLAQALVPDVERSELAAAMQETRSSGLDTINVLEAHLKKYPATTLKNDIYPVLAKAAIETKDDARIIKYAVPLLTSPQPSSDVNLLDRAAGALVRTGGQENAALALRFAQQLEDYVIRLPIPRGADAAKNQEDHDRILNRLLLYQSRALSILGGFDDARRKAALAYIAYPEAIALREWSALLEKLGKLDEAVARLADAFAIPDFRVTEAERSEDRRKLGALYKKLHDGSEKGLGDEILAAYDRTSDAVNKQLAQLRLLDPNLGLTDPARFTLAALKGEPLNLTGLRGKAVVFDYWATWCVPCRAQHPLYEEVRKRFEQRGDVVFLSVNTDEDASLVPSFIAEQKWSTNVYFDSGLVKLLSINTIPSTMIADKTGRIVSRMDGFFPDRFVEQLTARIQAALEVSAE